MKKVFSKLGTPSNIFLLGLIGILSSTGITYALTDIGIGDDIFIDTTKKFFLDGGSDTYLVESSSDRVDIVTGNQNTATFRPTYVEVRRDNNVGQLRFYGDRDIQTAGAAIGQMDFRGNNEIGEIVNYGRFQVVPTVVTDNQEEGYYRMLVSENGVLTEYMRWDGTGSDIEVRKPMDLQGNSINNVASITSSGDICIGNCP